MKDLAVRWSTDGTREAAAGQRRIVSLDAFRGLTIMLMILVNNPGDWGSIYAPLQHAQWHGWTPTDLVFPFFLFIVGVAIPLSLGRRTEVTARRTMVAHVVWRSIVLFALGLMISGFGLLLRLGPDDTVFDLLSSVRIPGVLQRIAICYLATSLLFLFTGRRTLYLVALASLLGYWALMAWVPVPGHGAGKIHEKDTHLAAYIDRTVIGSNHLWSAAKTWDPEGLLSTMPAVGTTLLGLFTGCWLKRDQPIIERLGGLLLAGLTLTFVGWCWGLVLPINKPIWTSSYAVFTAGLAMLVLGGCVLLFDVFAWKRLAVPLQIYGVNALTVFVLSGLVGRLLVAIEVGDEDSVTLKNWLYEHLFHSWLADKNASLAYGVAWVMGWFVVLAIMYRRKWIIKI